MIFRIWCQLIFSIRFLISIQFLFRIQFRSRNTIPIRKSDFVILIQRLSLSFHRSAIPIPHAMHSHNSDSAPISIPIPFRIQLWIQFRFVKNFDKFLIRDVNWAVENIFTCCAYRHYRCYFYKTKNYYAKINLHKIHSIINSYFVLCEPQPRRN